MLSTAARSGLGCLVIAAAAALALGGCRKGVPDDGWARELFAKRLAEIDGTAVAIETAARDFLPIHPPKDVDPSGGISFYALRAQRCDAVRQRIHDEIMKHPRFVEMRVDMRAKQKDGLPIDPCSNLGTAWSTPEERFGDVTAENGSTVGRWRLGRRLTSNREAPAIEVYKRVDFGDLTLDLRWTVVDDTASVKPLRWDR